MGKSLTRGKLVYIENVPVGTGVVGKGVGPPLEVLQKICYHAIVIAHNSYSHSCQASHYSRHGTIKCPSQNELGGKKVIRSSFGTGGLT